ncbi:hypothetical protein SAMN05216459_115103 [Ensifer sp. OV372]|nr:hypothetical protein SAMN05216459_115103 [Ensifer sp. OV372]
MDKELWRLGPPRRHHCQLAARLSPQIRMSSFGPEMPALRTDGSAEFLLVCPTARANHVRSRPKGSTTAGFAWALPAAQRTPLFFLYSSGLGRNLQHVQRCKKNARVGIMRVDDPCTVPDGHGRPVFLRRRARTRSPLSSGDRMVAVSISRIAPPGEIRPNKHGIDRRRDCGRCVQKSVGSTLPFSRNKCCLFDVERHSSASTAL